VKTVIPMHYATFPILSGTPEDLVAELDGTGIAVMAVEPGVDFTLP
jgi:L-ascorbate metabolism protein UlaG (beta-lactamase superfamily)